MISLSKYEHKAISLSEYEHKAMIFLSEYEHKAMIFLSEYEHKAMIFLSEYEHKTMISLSEYEHKSCFMPLTSTAPHVQWSFAGETEIHQWVWQSKRTSCLHPATMPNFVTRQTSRSRQHRKSSNTPCQITTLYVFHLENIEQAATLDNPGHSRYKKPHGKQPRNENKLLMPMEDRRNCNANGTPKGDPRTEMTCCTSVQK
ncbi:hypothetical protein CHS0354_030811 [Potamilus streckersoni]|uniref:Uncharacterized protein n=1 Tax=Potamilus streckersoni TaxID=2493646 RepID=A0AAE0WAQ6_9BIVA|nr:hypothetical protein CHS0354_030811 [Potamilus streckersoni]